MLNVQNLSAHHRSRKGKETVLHDINLTAQAGEITAIVGPSGAGKSTLLRAMIGDMPFDGAVSLNGQPLHTLSPSERARTRAVLEQSTPLAFPFTVIEVVRLGLLAHAHDDQIVVEALARVGLSDFAGRYYQDLSGGEQQRVQLARVLVQVWTPVEDGTPRWLFLDEPVSSLDIGHQLQIMRIARDFADAGGGVVMVMHDLNLTAMTADSVTLLSEGRLIAQDTPTHAMTSERLSTAYGCSLAVNTVPQSGVYILPQTAT
jgi:iron complex transport system ATP-binding protein